MGHWRNVPDETEPDRLVARLRALHQAALALAAPIPPTAESVAELLRQTVAHAVVALGAADGAIVLRDDPAWRDLLPATEDGARPAQPPGEAGLITVRHTGEPHRRPWRPEGSTTHVLTTGEPVWVPDTTSPSRFGPYPDLAAQGIHSFALVPLRAGGRILGRLGFNFARPGHLDAGEREAMELFAAHAAAALERARFLHEQAGRVAAEAAVRARDELMAVASHDVKNPLTVIKGTADNLLRQLHDGRLPPIDRLTERVERIAGAAARATALLDDMRATAAAAVAASGEPADLVALARAAVESYRDLAGARRLELFHDDESLVGQWDALGLERVLDNLLSNAVKYSPSGGAIAVTVRRERGSDGEWAVLEVEDEGVGIPSAELPRIFDRFYRGSNVARRVSGSGIGLSAVRSTVEQIGGAVTARSTEGAGATFTVRLPLAS